MVNNPLKLLYLWKSQECCHSLDQTQAPGKAADENPNPQLDRNI